MDVRVEGGDESDTKTPFSYKKIRIRVPQDAYENTWKCGELKLYFSPSAGGYKKKGKKKIRVP